MIGETSLLLVLAAVYVAACLRWIRADAVGFLTRRGGVEALRPERLPGNARGGFAFAGLVPATRRLYVCPLPPVATDEAGVAPRRADGVPPAVRPWEARFTARGPWVLAEGQRFVHAGSEAGARRVAEALARRDGAIEGLFDRAAIGARLDEVRRVARPVRVASAVAFAWLVVAPAVALRFGLVATWLPLIVAWAAIAPPLTVLFFRAHKRLHPAAGEERFARVLTVCLSPPEAARAADTLDAHALDGFHPALVAQVLGDDATFREVAGEHLRRLRHPPTFEHGVGDETRATVRAFEARLLGALEAHLRAAGVDPQSLLAAPPALEEGMRAYCPRCLAQNLMAEGDCPDCPGVALAPLRDAGAD